VKLLPNILKILVLIGQLLVKLLTKGHSERRQYYGETNEIVGKKISRALK